MSYMPIRYTIQVKLRGINKELQSIKTTPENLYINLCLFIFCNK